MPFVFLLIAKEVFLKRVLAAKLFAVSIPKLELRDGFEPPIFTMPLSHVGIGAYLKQVSHLLRVFHSPEPMSVHFGENVVAVANLKSLF